MIDEKIKKQLNKKSKDELIHIIEKLSSLTVVDKTLKDMFKGQSVSLKKIESFTHRIDNHLIGYQKANQQFLYFWLNVTDSSIKLQLGYDFLVYLLMTSDLSNQAMPSDFEDILFDTEVTVLNYMDECNALELAKKVYEDIVSFTVMSDLQDELINIFYDYFRFDD